MEPMTESPFVGFEPFKNQILALIKARVIKGLKVPYI